MSGQDFRKYSRVVIMTKCGCTRMTDAYGKRLIRIPLMYANRTWKPSKEYNKPPEMNETMYREFVFREQWDRETGLPVFEEV